MMHEAWWRDEPSEDESRELTDRDRFSSFPQDERKEHFVHDKWWTSDERGAIFAS
jgi:hypothetical protein